MTPLDILPLPEAKEYLLVEDDADDALITSLIEAAVNNFEQQTQWRLWDRAEVVEANGYTELFQYPVRSYAVTDYYTNEPYTGYYVKQDSVRLRVSFNNCSSYTTFVPKWNITLQVGYTESTQVPASIKLWLKKAVTWYYENRNSNELTVALVNDLNTWKRLVLW